MRACFSRSCVRAYPRSRGGTGDIDPGSQELTGLSPLTRGNRWDESVLFECDGPIPAHAGEPDDTLTGGLADGPIPAHAGEPDLSTTPW